MGSAMNEEVKYCNQCGVKITPEAKFCSSCRYDLLNSSTKTSLDKTIKVDVTNATVEKAFKAVGMGAKATGKGLMSSLTSLDKSLEDGIKATNRRLWFYLISLGKIIERIIIILIIGLILYGVGYVGFQLLE